MLLKLGDAGIQGTSLDLMFVYLNNSKQLVKENDAFSEYTTMNYGVPQGTILGPLIFSVFINDLSLVLKLKIILFISFADDTAIIYTVENWEDLKRR